MRLRLDLQWLVEVDTEIDLVDRRIEVARMVAYGGVSQLVHAPKGDELADDAPDVANQFFSAPRSRSADRNWSFAATRRPVRIALATHTSEVRMKRRWLSSASRIESALTWS